MKTTTETERITLAQFIEAHGITMMSVRIPKRTDAVEWDAAARHWLCTLSRGGMNTGKGPLMAQMSIQFSQGSAHTKEPTCEDVLDCLAMDAGSVENSRGFEDWCAELGYDIDSRKAEATYRACYAQGKELEDFIGDAEAFQTLLWNTERL